MNNEHFSPLTKFETLDPAMMRERATANYEQIKSRRTVRNFADTDVDLEVIKDCIRAAGTAPNGANLQPWHFAVVSNPKVKSEIRIQAEMEEREFYENRATDEWLEALQPFGTDASKAFLETAPHLIVIFGQTYHLDEKGDRVKHYYVNESVGIATGFLIQALHNSGLATLTHTPSPMKFLNTVLSRPGNERPFLVLVVGLPAENAMVPQITKKTLTEITSYH